MIIRRNWHIDFFATNNNRCSEANEGGTLSYGGCGSAPFLII